MTKTLIPPWRDNFKSSCTRVGFAIHLSRAMCEFISAVADGVQWDRTVYGSAASFPDNFLATSRSLLKRGLIEEKTENEQKIGRARDAKTNYDLWSWTHYRLTPAGVQMVELLKIAGLFIEADIAIEKKARVK